MFDALLLSSGRHIGTSASVVRGNPLVTVLKVEEKHTASDVSEGMQLNVGIFVCLIDLTIVLVRLQNSGQTSAAKRALSIPELLLAVFDEADPKTCAIAASVCHAWYELALDSLWRSLPNPIPLFGTLAPLELNYNDVLAGYSEVPIVFSCRISEVLLQSNSPAPSYEKIGIDS